jgi:hypothetical protein
VAGGLQKNRQARSVARERVRVGCVDRKTGAAISQSLLPEIF